MKCGKFTSNSKYHLSGNLYLYILNKYFFYLEENDVKLKLKYTDG